jgi:hypothetical protein
MELNSPVYIPCTNEQEKQEGKASEETSKRTSSTMNVLESGATSMNNKMNGASTLTSPTSVSPPPKENTIGHRNQAEGEGGELQLPVRFHKNGRKLAVPFVLKVSTTVIDDSQLMTRNRSLPGSPAAPVYPYHQLGYSSVESKPIGYEAAIESKVTRRVRERMGAMPPSPQLSTATGQQSFAFPGRQEPEEEARMRFMQYRQGGLASILRSRLVGNANHTY